LRLASFLYPQLQNVKVSSSAIMMTGAPPVEICALAATNVARNVGWTPRSCAGVF
jgi:hypothetical protein